MAQRKPRTEKRENGTAQVVIDTLPEAIHEQPKQEIPNGVLLVKQKDEQGNITVFPQIIGQVEATEVATIIKMAEIRWREILGFDK